MADDDARDVREMILRKLEKLTDDVGEVRSIVASTSATSAGLLNSVSDLRNELTSARKRYHDQFDKIHEFFQDDEHQLEALRARVSTIETRVSLVYKSIAVLGTLALAALSWVGSVFFK